MRRDLPGGRDKLVHELVDCGQLDHHLRSEAGNAHQRYDGMFRYLVHGARLGQADHTHAEPDSRGRADSSPSGSAWVRLRPSGAMSSRRARSRRGTTKHAAEGAVAAPWSTDRKRRLRQRDGVVAGWGILVAQDGESTCHLTLDPLGAHASVRRLASSSHLPRQLLHGMTALHAARVPGSRPAQQGPAGQIEVNGRLAQGARQRPCGPSSIAHAAWNGSENATASVNGRALNLPTLGVCSEVAIKLQDRVRMALVLAGPILPLCVFGAVFRRPGRRLAFTIRLQPQGIPCRREAHRQARASRWPPH